MTPLPDNQNTKKNIPSVFDHHECERPACADIQQMFRQQQQQQILNPPNVVKTTSNNLKNTDTTKTSPAVSDESKNDKSECPVDSNTLGRASWTLLHSMAAWYPDQPSTDDQYQITNFFHSLARFYPCTYCASDFQENLHKHPIKVRTREELCIWLCQQHNKVNQKLGKETFPCTMRRLDERWRKSNDPKCQR